MINAFIKNTTKCSQYKTRWLQQIIKCIKNSDKLTLCNNIENSDLIITVGDFVSDILTMYPNKKIIVYSCQDNAMITENLFTNDNIKLIFDHMKITNIGNDYEVINSNRSIFLLHDKYKTMNYDVTKINVPLYDQKCKSILNISNNYKNIYENVKPLNQRKYDVVFLGTIDYGDSYVTTFRKDTINNLLAICKKHKLTTINATHLQKQAFYNILNDTKIFVSPYGWGEFSLKEYECICKGCHILKSKIYFECYPNFYEHMDDYELDFSNFEEKILSILANLSDAQIKVDKNRKLFFDYNENEHLKIMEQYIISSINL